MHIGLQDWASEIDMRKLTLAGITLIGTYTYATADLRATVRALADADFSVILVEDACAAGTEDIHAAELATLNLLYCTVMTTEELMAFLPR